MGINARKRGETHSAHPPTPPRPRLPTVFSDHPPNSTEERYHIAGRATHLLQAPLPEPGATRVTASSPAPAVRLAAARAHGGCLACPLARALSNLIVVHLLLVNLLEQDAEGPVTLKIHWVAIGIHQLNLKDF